MFVDRLGSCGLVSIEPLDAAVDAPTVREWLAHPASAFWKMGDLTTPEVREYLEGVLTDERQDAWLGRVDGTPLFLVETYDPGRLLLEEVFDSKPGDLGMHLLVAPPTGQRVSGLTSAIMRAVVRFVFDTLGAQRVVVEPDVANARVQAKNAEVGFHVLRDVDLPDKRARLSVLTRADFAASHLAPGPMEAAHRHLVAKMLSEFTHERLLHPIDRGAGRYAVDLEACAYSFSATRHALEHWVVDETSIVRTVNEIEMPLDALELVVELQPLLGIPDQLVSLYLEEVSSTLASAAYKHHHGGPTAERLVTADFQTTESAMTEGHPAFVANNGRIGFGLDEFHAFAPETAAPIRLVWLAARREHAHLSLGRGLDEAALYASELGTETLGRFEATLRALGQDPRSYRYLPVHPWQWQHRLAITFAADVARRDLVLLGEGDDVYQAQQSIRTLFNRSRPERHYVKTAIAVQNMGFLRGLSPAYMRDTPAINDWVHDLVSADTTLGRAGFQVLRERAAIGWTGDIHYRVAHPSPYRKMVAALWRESPVTVVDANARLATMASLLHRDASGTALASALVRASGLSAADWVRAYLDAYLVPVIHCLRAHDLAFMPHGENVIVVFDEARPVRVLMKDIGEEIVVVGERDVPPSVRRTVHPVDDREKALAVFTDVFDGVFRYLAAILDGDGILPEQLFWKLVGDCVDRHDDEHPDLSGAVDLRARSFDHSCLNRLQLRNTLQMVDLASQSESLIYAGEMANPIGRS